MKYLILKQFIPGNDQIWVAKLNEADPIYVYNTIEEAEAKKAELEQDDPARGFKITTVTDEEIADI